MEIKSKEFVFNGEYPKCECGGTFLPVITTHDTYLGGGAYEASGQNLKWKCSKCEKKIS